MRHLTRMSRDRVNFLCAAHADATAADPTTELDSWKIGGKMFACFGDRIDGVCVKTDSAETAAMLINAGAAKENQRRNRSGVADDFNLDPVHIMEIEPPTGFIISVAVCGKSHCFHFDLNGIKIIDNDTQMVQSPTCLIAGICLWRGFGRVHA